MTSKLFEDFDERSREVRRYFILLSELESGSIQLSSIVNEQCIRTETVDSELAKTLKATGFLLLYNLIESTMRNIVEAICDEIQDNQIPFDYVSDKIKKIIIKNFKNSKTKLDELISELQVVSLDIVASNLREEKVFSGNVDAKEIRKVAKRYGFSATTDGRRTRDGIDLLQIKQNRNDLAHGIKSFEEVGRDATADELLRIQKRVVHYLKEIIANVEDYLAQQQYLK